ncbi:MAG: amidase [Alphaproteobacteria bacterium]|nr:amidase [Alphaproteobacteria bacterium]
MSKDLTLLSAVNAAEGIRSGQISSEQLVSQHISRINDTNGDIKAWSFLDFDGAMERAREADLIRKSGKATGALHGVPVGVKDIIDVQGMPTGLGNTSLGGAVAKENARVVECLLDAGAIVLGKTTTCELAYLHPTETTNPANAEYSPGGSSAGSAAAVAARHVPLSIGSQTGGSVIRPASFCGTYGFKPSRGVMSRFGFFQTSETLDQVGVFANHLEDAALLSDVISCYDQRDPHSFSWPRPEMLVGAKSDVPVEPIFCWFEMPYLDQCSDAVSDGLESIMDLLGDHVERLPVAPELASLPAVHKVIYDYEIARKVDKLLTKTGAELGSELLAAHERGMQISKSRYLDALDVKLSCERFFVQHFFDYDAVIAPSATGEAPLISEGHTGNAINCLTWTLAGLPCLSLPAMVGDHDLPIGLQLIAGKRHDDRLFRTSSWLTKYLQGKISENGGA